MHFLSITSINYILNYILVYILYRTATSAFGYVYMYMWLAEIVKMLCMNYSFPLCVMNVRLLLSPCVCSVPVHLQRSVIVIRARPGLTKKRAASPRALSPSPYLPWHSIHVNHHSTHLDPALVGRWVSPLSLSLKAHNLREIINS